MGDFSLRKVRSTQTAIGLHRFRVDADTPLCHLEKPGLPLVTDHGLLPPSG